MLKIAAIIVLIVIAAFAIVSYTELTPLNPETYSGTMTTETVTGLLFDREITIYPAKVQVAQGNGNEIGFSSDIGFVDFGLVPQGGVGNKFISVANTRDKTIQVMILIKGIDLVKADSSSFILKPGENRNVTMSANISDSTPVGNYTGRIDIFVAIPRAEVLSAVFVTQATSTNIFGR